MDGASKKFDQIGEIFPRFTEKNRESLLKTARSLLKIQREDAAMHTGRPPGSPSPDRFPQDEQSRREMPERRNE